jgi:D-3-phosphoglycerate dehydrogenase/C-terminal binding protein
MSGRFKVVIADFIKDALEPERKILGDLADVEALDAFHEDDLVGRIEDADAIMLYHHLGLSRRTIERLQHCKLIVRCGVGYDNIDFQFARERGIPVANVPDYGTEEVADSAIAMMMVLTRGVTYLNSRLRANVGRWHYTQVVPLYRLRGRVFGIVGLGRIGTAAALRAKALGMDVAFYDPYKPDGHDKALGVRRVERLDDLLSQSDILSLHCPRTEETQHMIDAAALARLPKGAYLINTARGAVVDTAAVPSAIESGQLAGAGIDVLACEPPPEDDPLVVAWRNPDHPAYHRVLLNPHSAFYSEEGLMDMRVKGSDACLRALTNQPIRNIVNAVCP